MTVLRLPDLSTTRVLVVGDVMLDRYWFGDVDRISPEAPVPIINVQRIEERAGGAANVAINVAALGAKCSLLSATGDDDAGTNLDEIVRGLDVDFHRLKNKQTTTTVKLRVMSRNQQLVRMDFEERPDLELLAECVGKFREMVGDSSVVLISDYGKGGLEHVSEMIDIARSKEVPVIVDPKGDDFSRYRGASMITPNRVEFEKVAGSFQTKEDLHRNAAALIESLGIESILITLSGEGMSLFRFDGEVFHSPSRALEVFDVSGAGDTVIAVIGALHGAGLDEPVQLAVANVAAGIVVGKLGTAVATMDEINLALDGGAKA